MVRMNELAKRPGKWGAVSLALPARLTFEEWAEVGTTLSAMSNGVMWWIGDWWRYGDQKYGERAAQALDSESYSYQTFMDAGWVSGQIETSRRREVLSWSHHREVAALEPAVQDELLDRAIQENWTRAEIRQAVNDYKRGVVRQALSLEATVQGKYSVIYADPPWEYSNSGLGGAAKGHYPTMDTPAIEAMGAELGPLLTDHAVLFLWSTAPMVTDALSVMKAWGFEHKTNAIWVKEQPTYGKLAFYVRGQHEWLLIGTRGSFVPNIPQDELPVSIIRGEQKEHSRKPATVYDMIEGMYPGERYLELFARGEGRPGWVTFGNESS
jgi:N6-adenosine-specific RNA methylase IME4